MINQEQMRGKADQLTGKIKEVWGRLTDDDIALYNGKREQFLGKLRETYGLEKEEAEDRLSQMEKAYNNSDKADKSDRAA